MPNRLAFETSPYLRQHAGNPVDWRPWGPEALAEARRERRPIFLSIGYAACHWCHVMERESFEDEEVAAFVNRHFVPIKVDREERPDVDEIYMHAVQAMTGQGGWPLTVFLTPDLKPFYGGTYFPPRTRWGRPGFLDLCRAVADAWESRRGDLERQAEDLARAVRGLATIPAPPAAPGRAHLEAAVRALRSAYDARHGGFGAAPKFPHAGDLRLLLRWWRRSGNAEALGMATTTLRKMALGGIYDHLGGGFHRYSTDAEWLVPHFEKMLYDQALLVRAYVEAWRAAREPLFARVARETCDFVLRELAHPDGVLHATLDADSEGEEGKFYVWTPDEVREALGDGAEAFCEAYDVTPHGNWEGTSILRRLDDDETVVERLAPARARLLEARARRVRPGLDEKVLASWNGLMIGALAEAGLALGRRDLVEAAERAARGVLDRSRAPDGGLLHVWAPSSGAAKVEGLLEDYAYLAEGLVPLHAATGDPAWIDEAARLLEAALERFGGAAGEGGALFAAPERDDLIARSRAPFDGATPSPNASAAAALVAVGRIAGRADLLEAGEAILAALAGLVERVPTAFAHALCAVDLLLPPRRDVVVAGGAGEEDLVRVLAETFAPETLVGRVGAGGRPPPPWPTAAGKGPVGGRAAAYVCRDLACEAPTTDAAALRAALEKPPA